jgi:hypothetical protein
MAGEGKRPGSFRQATAVFVQSTIKDHIKGGSNAKFV